MTGKRILELGGAAAGILGAAGLTYIFTESVRYTTISLIALAILVALLILIDAIPNVRRPAFFRRFGLRQYKGRFSVPIKKEKITIDDDYTALTETKKKFCFHTPPHAGDLVDTIEVLPGGNISEHDYQAEGCQLVSVKKKKDNLVAIFWSPKSKIKVGVPFWHKSSYICKDVNAYGPHVFWQGYMVDADTGQCDWTFECPEPIERSYAFRMSRFRSKITRSRLWKLGEGKRLRNCVQPRILNADRTIEWNISDPMYGSTYILIAIYEGGQPTLDGWKTAID